MRTFLFVGAVALSFPLAVSPAVANERILDGALGGAAGGVLFGPVGLVAGAAVGATAGPAIASSWGLKGKRKKVRRARYR